MAQTIFINQAAPSCATLISGGYKGTLRIINPKEDEVQGIKVFHDAKELPPTELAILVVAAKFCPDYVEMLASEKEVKAFIIISAGFGEETKAGAELENASSKHAINMMLP